MTFSIRLAGCLIALTALASQGALADEPQKPREACRQDVQTLCAGVAPGQGRIIACLADHKDQLSAGCRDALEAAKARRPQSGGDGR